LSITVRPFTGCGMMLTVQDMVDEVRDALDSKLRVRGPSLEAQIRKAGRLLPRRVRRDAMFLAQCVGLAANPKLARMIDMPRAKHAHRNVLAHLEGVDMMAQRRGMALNIIASIAFALLVTGGLVLFVLVQRGLV